MVWLPFYRQVTADACPWVLSKTGHSSQLHPVVNMANSGFKLAFKWL